MKTTPNLGSMTHKKWGPHPDRKRPGQRDHKWLGPRANMFRRPELARAPARVGSVFFPKGNMFSPEGNKFFPKGNMFFPKGNVFFPKGNIFSPKGNVFFPKAN